MAGSILGFSLPTFWVGLMLIMVFAVDARLAPVDRARLDRDPSPASRSASCTADGLRHLLLPAFNLALFKLSLMTRLARAGAREARCRTTSSSRAPRASRRSRVVLVHILKNILIPVVTVIGLEFGGLIAFSRGHRDHCSPGRAWVSC